MKVLFLLVLTCVIALADDFEKIGEYKPIDVPQSVKVSIAKDTYLVSGVEVGGNAESDAQAFDNALYNAKFIAFRALKNSIEDSVLPEDSSLIDSAMSGFIPSGGQFEDGVYKAKFDILFDKNKVASLISDRKMIGQQMARTGEESVVARIAIKNNVQNWVKVRTRLDQAKIRYHVMSLSLNEVEVVFQKVNVLQLTEDLKEAGLDLVANRSFYFISLPVFS